MLSVVRQATEYFALEQTSKQVLELMGKFRKEWGNFTTKFDKIDSAISNLRDVFNEISTTRTEKLDSVLNDIEKLRKGFLTGTTEPGKEEELKDN